MSSAIIRMLSYRPGVLVLAVLWLVFQPAATVAASDANDGVSGRPQSLPTESLAIITSHGRATFRVMVADNDLTREIGLMYRKHMGRSEGMIFDFHDPQPVTFWMENTILPLDIIFIDAGGRVVNIAANARPFDRSYLPSNGPVRAVLEINGGLASRLGVQPGDRVVDERIYRR